MSTENGTSRIGQLIQISKGPVWDGDLMSKHDRDELVKSGYVARVDGWNYLATAGVSVCVALDILRS